MYLVSFISATSQLEALVEGPMLNEASVQLQWSVSFLVLVLAWIDDPVTGNGAGLHSEVWDSHERETERYEAQVSGLGNGPAGHVNLVQRREGKEELPLWIISQSENSQAAFFFLRRRSFSGKGWGGVAYLGCGDEVRMEGQPIRNHPQARCPSR